MGFSLLENFPGATVPLAVPSRYLSLSAGRLFGGGLTLGFARHIGASVAVISDWDIWCCAELEVRGVSGIE